MKAIANFKFSACSRAAFLRGALVLSAFLLFAAALLALSPQAAAQVLATVYIENDPKFRTAGPCAVLGGTLQVAPNGRQVCSGIDQSGTFCIVGARDVFPCRGLYKHVVRCNAEFIRPAVNPFICGARCDEETNGFPRGAECTFDIPANPPVVAPLLIVDPTKIPGIVELIGVGDESGAGTNPTVTVVFGSAPANYRVTGIVTVNVNNFFGPNDESVLKLGPDARIAFADGEYVIDPAERAIIVKGDNGGVYWDDPRSDWARAVVAEAAGATVLLDGTAFAIDVANSAVDFVLYEGVGEASDVSTPGAAIFLRCDQTGGEGRARTGNYTTECYGDLATDSTGPMLALNGAALEADADYPNPEAAQLVASGPAMLTMRGGRGRGTGETAADYSPQIAFTGENTVAIKNDAAGGERYVQGGGFSIDGGAVGCDHTSETVLRYVGGVAAYCPAGLDAFAQIAPPPVGVANTGFVGGGVLLTVNPGAIAGVDNLYSVVAPIGFSVDESGALFGGVDGISNLTDGPNDVIVNQRIGVVPGSGLPEERMIDLNVHKLSDTGAPVVILIGKDPADASLTDSDIFPNGRGVSGDNLGFVFEDVDILGVVDDGLTVANVIYDSSTNEFSIGAMLTESDISDNYIVVMMTASNVRGTHIMTVDVHVVGVIQIEPANLVSPNENIAVGGLFLSGGHALSIAAHARLENSGAQGNVTFRCGVVGGADQSDFSAHGTETGCGAKLDAAVSDFGTSKEVQIEIVHSATDAYTRRLLAPFGGKQPDGGGNSIPDTVITANITVWRVGPVTQYANVNSGGEVAGIFFEPPQNPGGIDFGGNEIPAVWVNPVGLYLDLGDGQLEVDRDSGEIRGHVSDRVDDNATTGVYVVTMEVFFFHPLLLGAPALVEMQLTVSDLSVPTTLNVAAANANGNVIVRIEGEIRATVGAAAMEIVADTNRVLIEIVAVPNPGYHVDAWNVGGIRACAGGEFTGRGGFKTCILPNRADDLPINLTVAFAAGAIHPDLPETDDVPADIHTCFALGGSVQSSSVSISCSGFTSDSSFSSSCSIATSVGAPTCPEIFNQVRDCNLNNSPAATTDPVSDSVTCGTACAAGQFAVGGYCVSTVDAAHKVVTYAQPASGGAIAAHYASNGAEVASGDLVPHGALISVVGTPASNAYVADWPASCENDTDLSGGPASISPETLAPPSTGGFSDTGVKFCLARATVNVDASAFFAEIPANYVPLPPILPIVDDVGDNASFQRALCEAYGGTFESAGGVGKCSGLWSNDSSLSCTFGSATAAGNCVAPMRGVKECNDKNKPAANLDNSVTSCGDVCVPDQFARGASCVIS